MICQKCGAKNSETSNFCEKCGYNIQNEPKNISENETGFFTTQNVLIIGVFILIGIIGAGLIIAFSTSGEDNSYDYNNEGQASYQKVSYQNGFPVSRAPDLASEVLRGGDFNYITIDGVQLSKYQCLYILSKAIVKIDNGEGGTIPIKDFYSPSNPYGRISSTTVTKSQYIDMAYRTGNFFDNNGIAPNYVGINIPAKDDVSPNNMLRLLAYALIEYKSSGHLPSTVSY